MKWIQFKKKVEIYVNSKNILRKSNQFQQRETNQSEQECIEIEILTTNACQIEQR